MKKVKCILFKKDRSIIFREMDFLNETAMVPYEIIDGDFFKTENSKDVTYKRIYSMEILGIQYALFEEI